MSAGTMRRGLVPGEESCRRDVGRRAGIYSTEPFASTDPLIFSFKEQRVGLRHGVLQTTWQKSRPVASDISVTKGIQAETIIEDVHSGASAGPRFVVIEDHTSDISVRGGESVATTRIGSAEVTVQIKQAALGRVGTFGTAVRRLQIKSLDQLALKARRLDRCFRYDRRGIRPVMLQLNASQERSGGSE